MVPAEPQRGPLLNGVDVEDDQPVMVERFRLDVATIMSWAAAVGCGLLGVIGLLVVVVFGFVLAASQVLLRTARQAWADLAVPRVVYTCYTEHPMRGDYLVPVKRPGWEPLATVDKPGAIAPEDAAAKWADYDNVRYVSGLVLRVQDEADAITGVFDKHEHPEGHRIATCVGLWPLCGQDHRKTVREMPEILDLEGEPDQRIVRCEYARFDYDHTPSDLHPLYLQVMLVAMVCVMHALFWTLSMVYGANTTIMWIPLPTHIWNTNAWVVLTWPLRFAVWFFLGLDGHGLYRASLALSSAFTDWIWLLLLQCLGMSFTTALMDYASRRLTSPTWQLPSRRRALVHLGLLAIAALTAFLPMLENMNRVATWILAFYAALTIKPLQRDWIRVPKNVQLAHFLSAKHIPNPARVFTKIQTQWGRSAKGLMSIVRDAVVQAFQEDGGADFGAYDTGAVEALALLCSPDPIDTDYGFTKARRKKLQKLARADYSWSPHLNGYYPIYGNRQCTRPGCGAERVKGKWPHGLCPRCTAAHKALDYEGLGHDWTVGRHVCQQLDVVYPGITAIPELELPLAKISLDEDVVMFDQVGQYGTHTEWCPLRQLRGARPADVKRALRALSTKTKKVSQCPCLMERLTQRPLQPAADRIAGHLIGFGIDACPPYVTFKSALNVLRAIAARIARKRDIKPSPGIWKWAEGLIGATPLLPNWGAIPVPPLTTAEWLKGFLPSRAKVLQRCLTAWHEFGRATNDRFWRFRIFIKREWGARSEPMAGGLNYMTPILTNKPRSIQPPYGVVPCEDVGHIIAGPALRALTHHVKLRWNSTAPVFYASVSPQELDEWLNLHRHAGCWLWSDYTMYDMTHSDQTWDFIEPLYHRALNAADINNDYFQQLLRHWRAPVGRAAVKWGGWTQVIRYFSIAMNASGRDDTALANVLLNGVAMFLSLTAIFYGVPLRDVRVEHLEAVVGILHIAVVGDDCLAALPSRTLSGKAWQENCATLQAHLSQFGFVAKVGASNRIHDAVFLGCRPYMVAGRWWWGPTLGRRLYKHHCCIHTSANPYAWLNGVAQMEMDHLGFVPLLGAMGRHARLLLKGKKSTPWRPDRYSGMDWSERQAPRMPDDSTYVECAAAYTNAGGTLTVEDLLEAEQVIAGVRELPAIVSGAAFSRVVAHDDL